MQQREIDAYRFRYCGGRMPRRRGVRPAQSSGLPKGYAFIPRRPQTPYIPRHEHTLDQWCAHQSRTHRQPLDPALVQAVLAIAALAIGAVVWFLGLV